MPEFGWAYVVGTMVQGVSGSVQTAANQRLSGSRKLVYNETSGTLNLTGALNVSGAINANEFNVNVINKSVINLDASGSTKFGDTNDDTHIFTGSMFLSSSDHPLQLKGLVSSPASSSNHYLALDSNFNVILTASDGGPGSSGLITTYDNPGNNRVITSIDANGINAEANFTFNGSTLNVTGNLISSVGMSSSVGEYTELTASHLKSTVITDGTAIFKTGSIGNLTSLEASNIHGTIINPAQTNITSVGTLTGLEVDGNLSASVLYANDATKRVGIGRQDPVRKLEVITTDPQLRLSYTDFELFGTADIFTDIYTNNNGHLILSGSAVNSRVGIGTTSPTRMLDVDGDMRVSGNLEVSGTLSARVTDFIVSADSITFGDSRTDTLTFNAATASIPNDLNFASNLLVIDNANSRVGVGVQYPQTKMQVLDTNTQFKLSYDASNSTSFQVNSQGNLNITPSGQSITASSDLFVSGNLTFLGALSSAVGFSGSTGHFSNLTSDDLVTSRLTVGSSTVVITPTTISGATTVTSTNYVGKITTPAQPEITSVGTLTALNVDGNVSASALYVNHATQKVGIGRNDPVRKLEVITTDPQLRLSYTDFELFGTADVFTDIYTNNNGYLILSGTGDRVGIGTSTPSEMLDVDGNVRIGGDLYVTGAVRAKVSEFIVSANNITFGDAATDSLTFNASSGTVPNGLNLDSNTWVLDSDNNRIGIGVEHPDYTLDVGGNIGVDEFIYHNGDDNTYLRFQDDQAHIKAGGMSMIKMHEAAVDSVILLNKDKDTIKIGIGTEIPEVDLHLSGAMIITENLAVTGSITGSMITDGTAVFKTGSIGHLNSLDATNIYGTIRNPSQTLITTLGTLTSLNVSGDLSSSVLYDNSTTRKVGIGVTDPQKRLEILDNTDAQLRLTFARATGFPSASPLKASDIYTDSNGHLIMSASLGITELKNTLKLSGLVSAAGISTKYLALDASNNVILTSSVAPATEIRNRRVVTGNTTLLDTDYYLGVVASGDITVALADAATLNNGQTFTIKDEAGTANTHTVIISASAGQTIDGLSTQQIESPFGAFNIYTDGVSKYFIF